jgi:preprotein translocase subunit SecY
MSFCPNPECPHKKRTAEPAEFLEGFTYCSDCGNLLTERPPETEEVKALKPPKSKEKTSLQKHSHDDFYKRLLYTISMVLLWKVMTYIPAPGTDHSAVMEYLGNASSLPKIFFRVSIFGLGLMPYISAYLLVEILSLFAPPLKLWRAEGYQGRAKLKRIALLVTLALAALQGYGIAQGVETMSQGEFITNPGAGFRMVFTLTLMTGTFITILIAELISRKGIGHGISILIFTGYVGGISWRFLQFKDAINKINNVSNVSFPIMHLILIMLLVSISAAFIILFEKSHRKIPVKFNDGTEAYMPLKLTTAGIVPLNMASIFVMLPLTLAGYISNPTLRKISFSLMHGKAVYVICLLVTIILFYYFFTALFHRPDSMINYLKGIKASFVTPLEINTERYIHNSIQLMATVGAVYLCIFVFIREIFLRFWDVYVEGVFVINVSFSFFGSAALIAAVAIGLDFIDEASLRRRLGEFVKVAEFHDVAKAGFLKSLLEQKGIQCYLRGYYHRALLYFFGPYIEISAFVQKEMTDKAKEVINRYLE